MCFYYELYSYIDDSRNIVFINSKTIWLGVVAGRLTYLLYVYVIIFCRNSSSSFAHPATLLIYIERLESNFPLFFSCDIPVTGDAIYQTSFL